MNSNILKIQSFIANNYDLERLESKIKEFNPLKVLKIENHEIRHSNILAWLLNPNENHKLGDQFLKKFLCEVIVNNENIVTELSVFDIQIKNFNDIEIKREWNNIDIIIVSPTNKIVFFIENKVYSKESKGQLEKYFQTIEESFKEFEKLPIFLTLDNQAPSDQRYASIAHNQILTILNFVIDINKENLSPKVHDFIHFYLKTLELFTMENEDIKGLCKKIYKEHQEALDLIWKYSEETEFENAANEFISNIEAEKIWVDGKWAWFIPKEYSQIIKKIGEESWCNGYPFAFWFVKQSEKLGIILEVGPFLEESKRKEFLDMLKKHRITFSKRAYKPGARYTRFFTKYPAFDNWDDKDMIIEKMEILFNKSAKENREKLLNACQEFNW